jgi:hypothetical protein
MTLQTFVNPVVRARDPPHLPTKRICFSTSGSDMAANARYAGHYIEGLLPMHIFSRLTDLGDRRRTQQNSSRVRIN